MSKHTPRDGLLKYAKLYINLIFDSFEDMIQADKQTYTQTIKFCEKGCYCKPSSSNL